MSVNNLKLDIPAIAGGIRTAGALLIGNSALIAVGVIGNSSAPKMTATSVFAIGATMLITASLQRSKS
jgi:hydrogenase maturation factor HypE